MGEVKLVWHMIIQEDLIHLEMSERQRPVGCGRISRTDWVMEVSALDGDRR